MTELERRALLGDKDAQEECTEKGIMLPCPVCYKHAVAENDGIHERRSNAPSSSADYNTTWRVRCSWCGHESHRRTTEFFFDRNDGTIRILGEDGKKLALKDWNTRPAPPIGRCEECKRFGRNTENDTYCSCVGGLTDPEEDDFCSYFEPKEE